MSGDYIIFINLIFLPSFFNSLLKETLLLKDISLKVDLVKYKMMIKSKSLISL